jgi:hypothetical protein
LRQIHVGLAPPHLNQRVVVGGPQEDFVARIRLLMKSGLNFELVARETLHDLFGESPSAVLVSFLGKPGMSDPQLFVEKLGKMFQRTDLPVFELVLKRAEASLDSRQIQEATTYERVMTDLRSAKPESDESEDKNASYLHDHRKKDQVDEWQEKQE